MSGEGVRTERKEGGGRGRREEGDDGRRRDSSDSVLKVETGLCSFPTLEIELSVSVPVILAAPPTPDPRPLSSTSTSALHSLQAIRGTALIRLASRWHPPKKPNGSIRPNATAVSKSAALETLRVGTFWKSPAVISAFTPAPVTFLSRHQRSRQSPERHDRRQGVWTLLRSSRAPEQSACPSTTSALKHTQDKLILQSSAYPAPTPPAPRLPDCPHSPPLRLRLSLRLSLLFNPRRRDRSFACIASSSTIHTSGWIAARPSCLLVVRPKDGSHDPVTYPSAQSAGCQRRAGWDAQSSTSDSLAPSQGWMPED
ncbi:unnamed protein product [Pleuronectes platessa]|uniref:Uncharacterized protein n=1 Tax=Pleuronectes platessa TaxID=8262 RepID=A0A9N7V017_PLEPL|nr:unnamed protein product [Pleuronectes platessa]